MIKNIILIVKLVPKKQIQQIQNKHIISTIILVNITSPESLIASTRQWVGAIKLSGLVINH